MLHHIKRFIPPSALRLYHRFLAITAAVIFRFPANQLIVIGVTGTNGKSTTVSLIAKILEAAEYQVGATSTVLFKIGSTEKLNDQKMTMVGRFQLQRLLRQMVSAGCQYAVIEVSSQGLDQFRHWGINFDVAVFTNLTPEHIEAHGGFANYKAAKLKLFATLAAGPIKKIGGRAIKKVIIANADDEHYQDFINFSGPQVITYGLSNPATQIRAEVAVYHETGLTFAVRQQKFALALFGQFNIYNVLSALAVAESQSIDWSVAAKALGELTVIPGRVEFIQVGQPFTVIVDYAPEPTSLTQLYDTIDRHQLRAPGQKLIQVLGSCGGGRDVARRPILGKLAGAKADYVIVTNEDPYDDPPEEIMQMVASGAMMAGKKIGVDLFLILDRRLAIEKALSLAQPGDVVLLTGKGAEQAICVANGQKLPWDERAVARELLLAN